MNVNRYQQELEIASHLAREAGRAIMDVYFGHLETLLKQDGTPVTNADFRATDIIVEGLERAFPSDSIVSEERPGTAPDKARVWYVDPLDGTRGFTERSDQFAVHIGLAEEQRPVLGIVYKPTTGETYSGIKGRGAYHSVPGILERKLEILPSREGFSIVVDKNALKEPHWQKVEEVFAPARIMVSGSQGLRMMKVAENIADLHFSNSPTSCSTWDLCAPHSIVLEAGGYVRYLDGEPVLYRGQRKLGKHFVVARNEEVGEKARELLQQILQDNNINKVL